ncbi:hypothetical protein [Bdellovibrio sp. HCB337]|uniref:hypothetical protein n=1 Tax=Bdellovibrio sp. HCB337 TaxID=3394358 RepID=UPI0039A56388
MKTVYVTVLLALLGSFAQAEGRFVMSDKTIGNTHVVVTSEAPKKDGGQILFKNVLVEVGGKTLRIANDQLYKSDLANSFCESQEFKHFYSRVETSDGEEMLVLNTGEVFTTDNSVVVTSIMCLEEVY